jgi:hypothetical protein
MQIVRESSRRKNFGGSIGVWQEQKTICRRRILAGVKKLGGDKEFDSN